MSTFESAREIVRDIVGVLPTCFDDSASLDDCLLISCLGAVSFVRAIDSLTIDSKKELLSCLESIGDWAGRDTGVGGPRGSWEGRKEYGIGLEGICPELYPAGGFE